MLGCVLFTAKGQALVSLDGPTPCFPEQARVIETIQDEFQQRTRLVSYGWWPCLEVNPLPEEPRFHWCPPSGSFNMLQKKLKVGNRLAKLCLLDDP